MKTIIVFGGNSQLAQCIKNLEGRFPELNMVFLSSKEADVSNPQAIESIIQKYKPHTIINCAAYTAVDQAESESEEAKIINTESPGILAEVCKRHDSLLIHISTDFVFEGNKAFPLKESDDTIPLSVYGKTKLDGEKEIIKNMERYIILRTSWLYSEYGHNFAKTMLRLGKEKESLGVVVDQIGTPTYAMDLAETILKIVDLNSADYGIYHYSNEGVASWFDFAHAIFKFANLKVKLSPISTAQFPTKAIRPAFSVMDKSKIREVFKIEIPHWQDSLESCLKVIKQNEVK
jgi:dTDP-4-dehydrorhamnose reductase